MHSGMKEPTPGEWIVLGCFLVFVFFSAGFISLYLGYTAADASKPFAVVCIRFGWLLVAIAIIPPVALTIYKKYIDK